MMAKFATPLTPGEQERMEGLIEVRKEIERKLREDPLTETEVAILTRERQRVKFLLFPLLYGKTGGFSD